METLSYEVVRDTCVLLCRERGNSVARALLWELGGYKLADLPPKMWGEFTRIARSLLACCRPDYHEDIRAEIAKIAREDSSCAQHPSDPNAAMIARDGPARVAIPKPRQLTVLAPSTAKPALAALSISADMEPRGFSHLKG